METTLKDQQIEVEETSENINQRTNQTEPNEQNTQTNEINEINSTETNQENEIPIQPHKPPKTYFERLGKKGKYLQLLVTLVPFLVPILGVIFNYIYHQFIIPSAERTFSKTTITTFRTIEIFELYAVAYHWFKAFFTKASSAPVDQYKKFLEDGEQPETCEKCGTLRYPRTHHCDICGSCIVRYDHHCSWLGCIGGHNLRHFQLTLVHVCIIFTFFLYILVNNFIYDRHNPEFYYKTHIVIFLVLFNFWFTAFINLTFQFVIASMNTTMIEFVEWGTKMIQERRWFKPKYYQSFVQNWRDAYLVRDDLSLFWYFFPYTPTYKKVEKGVNLNA